MKGPILIFTFLSRENFPSIFLAKLTFIPTHPVAEMREEKSIFQEGKIKVVQKYSFEEVDFFPYVFIFIKSDLLRYIKFTLFS